jgi:hypothetical protein
MFWIRKAYNVGSHSVYRFLGLASEDIVNSSSKISQSFCKNKRYKYRSMNLVSNPNYVTCLAIIIVFYL